MCRDNYVNNSHLHKFWIFSNVLKETFAGCKIMAKTKSRLSEIHWLTCMLSTVVCLLLWQPSGRAQVFPTINHHQVPHLPPLPNSTLEKPQTSSLLWPNPVHGAIWTDPSTLALPRLEKSRRETWGNLFCPVGQTAPSSLFFFLPGRASSYVGHSKYVTRPLEDGHSWAVTAVSGFCSKT